MDELLREFINESRDLIEDASKGFLKVEQDPSDKETINALFRVMHTLKGSSGIFEFLSPLTEAVHAGEDLLDEVREGNIELTPDIIDIFLDLLDQLNAWLDELEDSGTLGADAASISKEYKERLRSLMGEKEKKEEVIVEEGPSESVSQEIAPPVWLKNIPDKDRQSLYLEEKEIHAISYLPEQNCFFTGDDPVLLVKSTPSLKWCEIFFKEGEIDLQGFDPLVCEVGFHVISTASEEELKEHYLYVEDQVEIFSIPPKALVFPQGEKEGLELLSPFAEEGLALASEGKWEELKEKIRVAKEISSPEGFGYSCLSWIEALLGSSRQTERSLISSFITAITTGEFTLEEETSPVPVAPEEVTGEREEEGEEISQEEIALSLEILESQLKILQTPTQEEIEPGRRASIREVMRKVLTFLNRKDKIKDIEGILSGEGEIQLTPLKEIVEEIKKDMGMEQERGTTSPSPPPRREGTQPKHPPRAPAQRTEIKVLKVDQARIDTLMELVSELVVAKNSLPYLARKAEEVFGNKEMSRDLKIQYATINRICEDLQNAVMQIRMVPVSHTFQRFPRLVRDLSRKLGKKINLVLEGEDTRADKTVIEDLAEPLVHLIRNSIDHGIESPEERTSKGKPETGTIVLRALQLEDQILIEVEDDGRGINIEKVKRKAYEKGLISEEEVERLSEEQALQLLFAPGFSTAEQVSDLSGRGVGMDVVRTMVENLGGSVRIMSRENRGTTVQLALPLSMAVTRVLMVETHNELFGVPIENVAETVKVPREEIKFVKKRETIVLRDRLIPIYYLKEILGLNGDGGETPVEEEVAILIIQLKNSEFGLVVDRFHEGIDIVLKPLEGIMEKYTLYSGATLLGDGRVLLVLNPKEIVKWL